MGIYKVVRSDLPGSSPNPDDCWLLFPGRGETATSPLRYVKVELISAVVSSSPELQKMLSYSEGCSHKTFFLKNIRMPALISLAALKYQHPRGLLSFFLEAQLFSISLFTALGPGRTLEALSLPSREGCPRPLWHCPSHIGLPVFHFSVPSQELCFTVIISVNNFSWK